MSTGFSYKEALSNALRIFINRRISESKDIKEKIESLEEEKQKKALQKIVDFVVSKAKGLAELQDVNYVGVEDDTVVMWIDDFFDKFEENIKEPEKPVTPKTTSSRTALAKDKKYEVQDGLFDTEVKIDKKTILTKDEFIKKMKEENKGKEIEFIWTKDSVEVKAKTKAKEETPKEEASMLDEEKQEETSKNNDNEEVDIDEENDAIQMKINKQEAEEEEEEDPGFI